MTGSAKTTPVTPDFLSHRGSPLAALEKMARASTNIELLQTAHSLWCGAVCPEDVSCDFLHYSRGGGSTALGVSTPAPAPGPVRAARARYNKDTARLFGLMGSGGFESGVSTTPLGNVWPLLRDVLGRVDRLRASDGLVHSDYTDWTKKKDPSVDVSIQAMYRDTIHWLACWCGAEYAADVEGVHFVAWEGIADDICLPPLDVVSGRFTVYGRTLRNMIEGMEKQGWAQDGTFVLLCLVRLLFFQYVEKVDFGVGSVHGRLSKSSAIWDSIGYRTNSGGTTPVCAIIARNTGTGPLTMQWIIDSSVCNLISLDLTKSAVGIYDQDNHKPSAIVEGNWQRHEGKRDTDYRSVYLDLIDELVQADAPEPIVHYGNSGFLYGLINGRYMERSAGRRLPIHPTMVDEIRRIVGDAPPADARLKGLFHLRWLVSSNRPAAGPEAPRLCPDLVSACIKRQKQRKLAWDCLAGHAEPPLTAAAAAIDGSGHDGHLECACAENWTSAIHGLAPKASSPRDLLRLLVAAEGAVHLPVSDDGIAGIGSLDDVWALCIACQVDCGGDTCEWAAFTRHVWKVFGEKRHIVHGCST